MSSIWSNVPITSLAAVGNNHILAGQGQGLILLSLDGKVVDRLEVFRGSTVHHIISNNRKKGSWMIAGAKSCALVTVRDDKVMVEVKELVMTDWIMHCLVLT